MCILFMYVSNSCIKGGVSRSPYKLILASNRDEKFSRPTKPAHFWDSPGDSHILGGQDLEELGTWLGISKYGKLAMLLNIMGPSSNAENKEFISRGSLVTGFLRSPSGLAGCTYLKNLCHLDISQKYRPFHFITVDVFGCENEVSQNNGVNSCDYKQLAKESRTTACSASVNVTYLTNQNKQSGSTKESNASSSTSPEPKHIAPPANTCEFYAFGNSLTDKPFRKVECGKTDFEKLVRSKIEKSESNENSEDQEKTLVDELLQFLKSTEKYFPDEIMEDQAKRTGIPQHILPRFSSRFVSVPGVDYGTRTHTIVLVDIKNNVAFHEWTMNLPINPSSPEWSHSKFTFTLTSPETMT